MNWLTDMIDTLMVLTALPTGWEVKETNEGLPYFIEWVNFGHLINFEIEQSNLLFWTPFPIFLIPNYSALSLFIYTFSPTIAAIVSAKVKAVKFFVCKQRVNK